MRWTQALSAVAAAIGCIGCISSFARVVEPPRAPDATPDAALVVLVAQGGSSDVPYTVVDDEGRLLAQVMSGTHTLLTLAPGTHRIIIYHGRTQEDVLGVDVGAGHVYRAVVTFRGGAWRDSIDARAIRSTSPEWSSPGTLTEGTRQVETDFEQAAWDPQSAMPRVRRAMQRWSQYSEFERGLRTLEPADGVPSPGAPPLPTPPTDGAVVPASAVCLPGQQLGCPCPGGGAGVQVCREDGRSAGPCDCEP